MPDLVLLSAEHSTKAFDCGEPDQNAFLKDSALVAAAQGWSKTWVLTREKEVVAFYALANWQIQHSKSTPKVSAGARQGWSIPAVLLGQLGVDLRLQKGGVGSALLKHAITKCLAISETVGIRAMALHANPARIDFYRKRGFESLSENKPTYMMATLQDLKAAIERGS